MGRASEFSAEGISKSDKAILSTSYLKIEGHKEKPLGQISQSVTRRMVAPRRSTRLASLTILISSSLSLPRPSCTRMWVPGAGLACG